jgi:hypothetical protein
VVFFRQHTRLYATQHLGKIIKELGPETWALELLVTQLYDTSPQVSEVAAQNLEAVCENLDTLQVVVNMRPILDHLGDVGQALLMRQVTDRFGSIWYELTCGFDLFSDFCRHLSDFLTFWRLIILTERWTNGFT